ncbi:MAG TPA: hypothetical protein VJ179_01555, partial [Patescibacteria group bacterium]|nr:hypothetical protein [Patescibacteria group bacterium]
TFDRLTAESIRSQRELETIGVIQEAKASPRKESSTQEQVPVEDKEVFKKGSVLTRDLFTKHGRLMGQLLGVALFVSSIGGFYWFRAGEANKENYENRLVKQGVSKPDAEIIAEAKWDKGFYFRNKERIENLIDRDIDWATTVMLYMIAPDQQALKKSAMVEVKDWHKADLAELGAFKQVFLEKNYIQGSEGNRTFKQVTSDETAQKLFEESIRFQERGSTRDMGFPIRLNEYAVSKMDEIKRRGMLD